MKGRILASNGLANSYLNIENLNKGACIFNYIPSIFWNYHRILGIQENDKLELNSLDFEDQEKLILHPEKYFNDFEIFQKILADIFDSPELFFISEDYENLQHENIEEGQRFEIFRSLLVVLDKVDTKLFSKRIKNLVLGKMGLKTYQYGNDLNLRLIEITAAADLEENFLDFFKNLIKVQNNYIMENSFKNLTDLCNKKN